MKNKMIKTFCAILVIGFLAFTLTSCDLLFALLGGEGEEGDGAFLPTDAQMATALKQALTTGSNEAGATLSKKDAFYNNMARRIPLPPEAQKVSDDLKKLSQNSNVSGIAGEAVRGLINSINNKLADLLKGINASAEEASKQVGPIFAKAITDMTIYDAIIILRGEEGTEATEYLRGSTQEDLVKAFSPVLNEVLKEPLVAGESASSIWNGVVTEYNKIATNTLISLFGLSSMVPPIQNPDLSEFILEKAFTAVFNEIAEMEKKIRADPKKFITELFSDISAKVFDWAKGLLG